MQFENADKVIEIILQYVLFSEDREVTLSTVVGQKGRKVDIKWSVSAAGTTQKPVTFYNSYEDAWEELKRRCGEFSLGGFKILSNKKYGEIRGSYGVKPKTTGFVIKRVQVPEPEVESKYKEPTVRLEEFI